MNIPKLRQAIKQLMETEEEAPALEMSDISMLQEEDSTGTPVAKRRRNLSQSPLRSGSSASKSRVGTSGSSELQNVSLSEEEETKSPSKDLSKSPSKNASKSPSRRSRNASTIHQAMEAARLEEKAKMAAGVKRVQRGRGVKRATRAEMECNETIIEDKQVDSILEEEEERSKRRRLWR